MEKIKNLTAVFDLDVIIYKCGFAGESRVIEAKCIPTGEEFSFKNRTEMWGRGKKIGGWLEQYNLDREAKGLPLLTKEDFEITDVQLAEPIENVLHSVKTMISSAIKTLGASGMVGYIGGSKVPLKRWERSTLLEYKGNRKDALSPIYKQDIINYLISKYGARVVDDGHEADDWVVFHAYQKDNCVVVTTDKDSLGTPVLTYNLDQPEMGVVNGNCFGHLSWNPDKNKFEGHGRKFFYAQWLYGDDVDNYRANCMSEVKWGEKSAYESLKDCRNDKECFEVAREVYKKLYPEPIEVVGWRGDKIVIDWLYVAREIFDLARMKRFPEDEVDVADVFRKYKMI